VAEAFPISGSIDPKAFPFLLMDLNRQGATGSLKVDGPTYQKALYFRSGRVLFGSSNDPRDQLGSILIEAGKITPEQLEDVTAKVGPGNPLAKVLSDTGFVNQRELSEAARAKVERILSDVIAYTSGAFEFEDGVLPKGAIDLKLSTEKVLLAAVRRINDRAFVLRHLENLEVVLVPLANRASALAELQAETGGLVEQLDGQRTLKEAASRTRLDEFEAAKVACALLFLGLAGRGGEKSFITSNEEKTELDLGATASAAFVVESEPTLILPGDAAAAPVVLSEPESAFFVPDDEPEPEATPPIPPPEPVRAPPPPVAPARAHGVIPTPPAVVPEPEATVIMASPGPEPVVPAPEPSPAEATISIEPTLSMAPPAIAEPPAPRARSGSPALVYPPNAPSRPRTERPPLAKPASSRPSKDDLAALDVLLNPKAGPLAPMESGAREGDWTPQLNDGRRQARGIPRVALAGAGLLAVAAAVVAGLWYYRQNPNLLSFGGVRGASPTPPPRAVTPSTVPAPPTTVAAPPPTTIDARPPTTTVPATPAAVPSATRPLATPAPTPAPTAAPAASTLDEARRALQRGGYAEAARAFAAHIRKAPPGTSTVQLLVACSTETVQKAASEVGNRELFILPVNYKGRECFRMCWGLYPDAARAAAAMSALPDYFRRGGATPRVTAAADVLP